MEAAVSDRVSLRGIGFRCLKFVTQQQQQQQFIKVFPYLYMALPI